MGKPKKKDKREDNRERKREKAPKPTTPQPPSTGQVVADLALWSQAARIGGGLTPPQLSNIIEEANSGLPARLADLFNECRQRDSTLQGVCSVAEESIVRLDWTLMLPPNASEREKAISAWVEQALRRSPLRRLLPHLVGAIFFGFAVVEVIYRKESGKQVPDRFVPIAPRRFRFRQSDGKLVLCDQTTGFQEIDLEEHPHKFIICRPYGNGDAANREGLCRPLVWMSVMRNWSIGDWLKTGEMSWKPWRIGTFKKGGGTSHEDKAILETVMRKLTTDYSAVIPDSCKVDITWPGGSQASRSTHGEIVNMFAAEMSKCVLGQTETTQASSSSGYAQAKVHDGVRKDLRDARAAAIADDLTKYLVAAMVRLNFGENVTIPAFTFDLSEVADITAVADAATKLAAAGLPIAQSWLYEQLGCAAPREGEPVIGGDDEEDDGSNDPK